MKILTLLAAALLSLTTSCGSDAGASASPSGTKDRGSASMVVGGEAWTASSAKARLKDGHLKLEFGASDRAGSMTIRDQLALSLTDYTGPGTYQSSTGSQFVRVGIDTGNLAEDSAEDAVLSALGDSVMLILSDSEVTITADDGDSIEGTFRFEAPNGENKHIKAVKDGVFRALVRK